MTVKTGGDCIPPGFGGAGPMRERFPQFLRQVCSGVCRLKGRMDRHTYLVDRLAGSWARFREVRPTHVEQLVELDFSELMLHERRLYRLGMRRREREHWIAYEIGRLSQGWGSLGLERVLGSCAGMGLPVVSVGRQLGVMKCRLLGRRRHVCAWGRALGRTRRRGVRWARRPRFAEFSSARGPGSRGAARFCVSGRLGRRTPTQVPIMMDAGLDDEDDGYRSDDPVMNAGGRGAPAAPGDGMPGPAAAGLPMAESGVDEDWALPADLNELESTIFDELSEGRQGDVMDAEDAPWRVYDEAYKDQLVSLRVGNGVSILVGTTVEYWLQKHFEGAGPALMSDLWDRRGVLAAARPCGRDGAAVLA